MSLTDEEREMIETLHALRDGPVGTVYAEAEELIAPPEPGERCVTCGRRRNKPRKEDSPKVREVRFRAPADIIDAIEENFDMLQEYVGLDPYGFPRARLLEALLLQGIQTREELAAHFKGEEAP